MMIDPLRPRPGGDTRRVAAIKGWVRDALALGDDATVLVTELRCSEPGCPPLETVIAVMGPGATRQHKLPKAMAAVTPEDVRGVAHAEALPATRDASSGDGGNTV